MNPLAHPSPVAIGFFLVFIAITLGITAWAARKTKTTHEFFTAGGNVTGLQNGLALAGDYMSAASFLGIAGLVATSGFDGLIYSVGWLVGWPIVTFLVAEPLRNLGKFTFADVVAARLRERPVRTAAAAGTLVVVCFYLIAQMVGAGKLITMLFGLSYTSAVLLVGVVMLVYVLFGGMIATTWVQIVKAVLLLGGATLLAVLGLSHFHYSPLELFREASSRYGDATLAPGKLVSNPLEAVSLGLALMFGTAGLPHVLMRFYTVKDAKTARTSVVYATGFIGFFYLVTFVLGFAASVVVGREAVLAVDKGGNMAAPLLAFALGGHPFLGFISAVAFATILAVVAGLTLSGAAALAHDLYGGAMRDGKATDTEKMRVARIATVGLGVSAVLLGLLFEGQNVAFMVGLAFAVAASTNLPVLLLSMLWRKFSTGGAVMAVVVGLVASVGLIALSPTVMVDIFKASHALVPLKNPAIVSIPLGFLGGVVGSLVFPDATSAAKYDDVKRRMALGASVTALVLTFALVPGLARADEEKPVPPEAPVTSGTAVPTPVEAKPPLSATTERVASPARAPEREPPPQAPPPSRPVVEATPKGLKLPGGVEVTWFGIVKPTIVVGTGVESFGAQSHVATTAAQNPVFASPAGSPDAAAFSFQLAQSRFGLDAGTKTVSAKIELDFVQFQLASPVQAGFPRLRQAYVTYEPRAGHRLALGQMWDTFSPLNSHTFDLVGGLFQAGNTGFMRNQVAYRVDLDHLELTAAVGMPTQNTATQLSVVEYGLVPTFALRAAYKEKGQLYLGVSGIVSEVGVTKDRSRTAGAVNAFVDATLGPLSLKAEVVAGQNLNNLGLLSLSTASAERDVGEVGGWVSAKVNASPLHALHVSAGVAAVTNPSALRAGYSPANTGADGKVTAATRVSANGPGIEENVAIRAGYALSPAPGLSFVAEPYVFLTRHKLLGADEALGAARRAFGVQGGAMYTF
jgi:cation/acetate symporter